MVVAQFGGGLHEDLRAKVFGIPNPPATIDDVLTAASPAEAGSNNRETTTGSGCRQITSPVNPYLPNFTNVLEETRF